ncbi:MAG: SHOCT domain-containing protein [Methylophaga sp.]|nr:SHOCT domain-containing protein [Methylophaga sp.]
MFADYSGWMGAGMWIFWILFPIVIIVLLTVLYISGSTSLSGESPMEILKARYACGEIDDEEFLRRRHELEKQVK